jgi:hypothetical protein
VPFWLKTTFISYGSYRGYIYLSKSPDLANCPTSVGQRPTSVGQRPTSVGQRPTSVGQRPTTVGQCPTAVGSHNPVPLHDSLPLHHILPSQDTNTSEERKNINHKNTEYNINTYPTCKRSIQPFRYISIILPLLNSLTLPVFL